MDDAEFDRIDNPFAAFADRSGQTRRSVVSTCKFLALTVALFAIVTAAQAYLHQYRISSLVDGFADQSRTEKMATLRSLQAAGPDGIAGLTAALADKDPGVAELAGELICDLERGWTTLPALRQERFRQSLAESLASVANGLSPDDSIGRQRIERLARRQSEKWMSTLASNQTTSPAQTETLRTLLAIIGETPARSPTNSPAGGMSNLNSPLPLDQVAAGQEHWTDWPPRSETPKLYRPQITTLQPQSSVVLAQASTDVGATSDPAVTLAGAEMQTQSASPSAELLRPTVAAVSRLRDRDDLEHLAPEEAVAVWTGQLASPNRFLRKQAVHELLKLNNPAAAAALRNHLPNADPGVASMIRRGL